MKKTPRDNDRQVKSKNLRLIKVETDEESLYSSNENSEYESTENFDNKHIEIENKNDLKEIKNNDSHDNLVESVIKTEKIDEGFIQDLDENKINYMIMEDDATDCSELIDLDDDNDKYLKDTEGNLVRLSVIRDSSFKDLDEVYASLGSDF